MTRSPTTGPLTDAQRALADSCVALAVRIATDHTRGWPAHDRDDAIGEALLQVCLGARTFDPARGYTPGTHLGKAAWYAILTEYRRRARRGFSGLRRHDTLAETRAAAPDPVALDRAADVAAAEAADPPAPDWEVRAAVAALPARERHVVVRTFFEGARLADVGPEIGVSKERVRQLRVAALARLRAALGRDDDGR